MYNAIGNNAIFSQKRTRTRIHIVSTFFYESMKRHMMEEQRHADIKERKTRKQKQSTLFSYIKGEPGELSLILTYPTRIGFCV